MKLSAEHVSIRLDDPPSRASTRSAGRGRPAVPALWPSWLNPRRIALGGIVLLFVDAILSPAFTPAGLSLAAAALRQMLAPESLRALACLAAPSLSLGLVCVLPAMHGRSAVRAALGCLAAGMVFGMVTCAGAYWMLMSMTPRYDGHGGAEEMITGMLLPGQALAFTLSVLGLALPVSRSHRIPSCDAVHEALIVTGAWLLAAGTLVYWNGFGLTIAVHSRLLPSTWSLPCVLMGLTMLVTGILADRRMLAWLGSVRRGEEPGWRIEPLADRDVEVPSLLRSPRTPELEGLLILDRDAAPLPVARVFLEGSDIRRLLGARLRAVAVAVVLLLAVLPVLLAVVWPRRHG